MAYVFEVLYPACSCLNRPVIGIFDSGSGGLSVLAALRRRAPFADVVYFGDIANNPYGTRSNEELAELVKNGCKRLAEYGATEIIAACNSISYAVLAGATGHDRLVEMTRPAARMMRRYAGERVLLLATPATVASGIYREALWSIVALDELPISELAAAIESEKGSVEISAIIRAALATRTGNTYDKILLGCTHYPLVQNEIAAVARELFPEAQLLDPADAVAEEAAQRFASEGEGSIQFLISADSHGFRNRIAPMYLEGKCSLTVI